MLLFLFLLLISLIIVVIFFVILLILLFLVLLSLLLSEVFLLGVRAARNPITLMSQGSKGGMKVGGVIPR